MIPFHGAIQKKNDVHEEKSGDTEKKSKKASQDIREVLPLILNHIFK